LQAFQFTTSFHFHGRNFIKNFQTRENDEFLKEIEFFHFGFESCFSSMKDEIIVKLLLSFSDWLNFA
jgi:hypothetical protein